VARIFLSREVSSGLANVHCQEHSKERIAGRRYMNNEELADHSPEKQRHLGNGGHEAVERETFY
jgi:hypothetical protein